LLDINQSADVENEGINKDDGVDATSESFPNSTGEKKPVTNILVLMAPVPNSNFSSLLNIHFIFSNHI